MNRPTPKLIVILIVLQAFTLLSVWTSHSLPAASAQIPNPGEQRIAQLDELRAINAKLDLMLATLKGGELQVRVKPADDRKGK